VLTAVVYVVLRLFAGPMLFHNTAPLCPVRLYIFLAGARRRPYGPAPSRHSSSLLRSSGVSSHPCSKRTDIALKVRFFATLGEESDVVVAVVGG
jgi:hypothetical protein